MNAPFSRPSRPSGPSWRRRILLAVLALAVPAAFGATMSFGTGVARAELATFEKSALTIETASGARRFAVELALTPEQMEQGLMYRRSLAPDAGMLFEYPSARPVSFWMKNTLIPLDMLFIDDAGRIVSIHERAVPLSTSTIDSDGAVRAVLEVNGGTAARLGIKPGDIVRHPFFGNTGG